MKDSLNVEEVMKTVFNQTVTTKSEKLLEDLLDQAMINLIKDSDLISTERHGPWECPECDRFVHDLGKLRQRIESWGKRKRIIIHCENCDAAKYSDDHFRLVGNLLNPLRFSMVEDLTKIVQKS